MPDRSKGIGQTMCSPGPRGWELGVGLCTLPRKNLLLGNNGGGQEPFRVVAPVTEKHPASTVTSKD
jgi:hypothetical protein